MCYVSVSQLQYRDNHKILGDQLCDKVQYHPTLVLMLVFQLSNTLPCSATGGSKGGQSTTENVSIERIQVTSQMWRSFELRAAFN